MRVIRTSHVTRGSRRSSIERYVLVGAAVVAFACSGDLSGEQATGVEPAGPNAGEGSSASSSGASTAQESSAGAVANAAGTSGMGLPGTGSPSNGDGQATSSGATPTEQGGAAAGSDPATGQPANTTTEFAPFEPAPGMLRRLTRTQLRNALRDVFDVEIDVSQLDADTFTEGFATIGAGSVVTSQRGVEQYEAMAEDVVASVFSDPTRRDALIGCTPSADVGDACVQSFVERVGRRMWRRPLTQEEVSRLTTLAQTAALELEDPVEGVRWATVALLTSPNFLYRAELGSTAASGELQFSSFEMASRLSFLLWNSVPDEALLDDAASGALDTIEGVRAAASRMLDAPQGRQSIGAFAEEFMRLDRVATQAKDANLFPEYTPELQAAMARDMRGVWESIAFDQQSSAFDLFTTREVIVNADLAQVYGLDATGLDSDTFEQRTLPADSPRAGILGKAGFLSQFANQKEGSPTLRGKFIRQILMCTPVPPPPGDADIVLDEPPADMPLTKRERLELHRTSPACAGCHQLMDPLGLPFESFDAIGRHRTTEHGLPIDPSGEFEGVAVSNSVEFGAAISVSDTVTDCLVRKYYSYAMGVAPRDVDLGVVADLTASFEASGHSLRDLVLDVATHEAFSAVGPQL